MASLVRSPFYSPKPLDDNTRLWQLQAEPQPSAVLELLLTSQKVFGAGGQVPTKRWSYDFDVAASVWPANPRGINLSIAATIQNPAQPARYYLPPYEQGCWTWEAPASALLLPLLTNVKVYGKGGQAPTKQWRYDYNVAESLWSGGPASAIQNLLVTTAPFNPKWPNYNYDVAESAWSGQSAGFSLSLRSLPTVTPFISAAWHVDYDYAGTWQFQPLLNLPVASTIQNPAQPARQYYQPDDHGAWQRTQVINASLYVTPGNPFVSKAWRYDYNDATFWSGVPTSSAVLSPLLTASKPFASKAWHYEYNDATTWQFTPAGSALLAPILTANKPFFSKAWHHDYNDATFWSWPAPASNVLTTTFNAPFVSAAWHLDYDDNASWNWTGLSSFYTVNFAQPPIPPTPTGGGVGWPQGPGRKRRHDPEEIARKIERQRPFGRKVWQELQAAWAAQLAAEKQAVKLAETDKRKRSDELANAARLARIALGDAELAQLRETRELHALTQALKAASSAKATMALIREAELRARALQNYLDELEDDEEAMVLLLS